MVDTRYLIPAVIRQESGGDPNALSPKGAAGIMQIMPDTARDPGYGVRPLQGWNGVDPRTAPVEEQVRFGSEYLNALAQNFGGDTKLALAAYNAGPGAVQQYGGVPPYKETQNYVANITGGQSASNWRSRATPAEQVQVTPASDWRSRAQPAGSDWRSRAVTVDLVDPLANKVPGQDMGAAAAGLQGFNSMVPFGERITAGLGAPLAYAADKVIGIEGDVGVGDYYRQIRAAQDTTREENPNAYIGGMLAGAAASIPLGMKGGIGTPPTTGLRGAINAIPEALSSVGGWVRGSKVASDAGKIAKATNLAGKVVRGAAVAYPAGAIYSYGASQNDLDTGAALSDADTGGRLAATVGGALPVVGAAAGKVIPKVSEEIAGLASVAKNKFGIDISLDQLAPTPVRSTIQKVSQALPLSGVTSFIDRQRSQFMAALARTIGEQGDNLGPDAIKNYLTRASSDFDNALQGKVVTIAPDDLTRVQKIATTATRKVTKDVAQIVRNNVDDFIRDLEPFKVGVQRTVPGERLASLRSKIVKELPSIDSQAREHVGDIVEVIDDAIARQLSPEEFQTLANARYQWRNFRTLEPLLEKSTDGTVDPTALMQRVASSKFIKASRKSVGEDDLVDLARIGKQFLKIKGGSDTVPNALMAGGTFGNAGIIAGTTLAGTPAAAIPLLLAQGAAVGGNRAYQRLVNQSPRLVSAAVKGSAAPTNVPLAGTAAYELLQQMRK